jgi:hypothetical protein
MVDPRAYTFCVLDQLRTALKRRDVFVHPIWRYADPRRGLLSGSEWEAAKQMVSCTLGYSSDPKPALDQLATELDQTYRTVAARLPINSALRFEGDRAKEELILNPLEKNEEPESLIVLRKAIADRMPQVDLTEILIEITAGTGLADAFTHVSEQTARAIDLDISLCAVMLAEACNTGIEPLVSTDVVAVRRDRLAWVGQNYLRDDTLIEANAKLVTMQNSLKLARMWGGGEVASADGLRFVVPVKTIHAGSKLNQLKQEGHKVLDEDVARLSPLIHDHINMLGRYSFAVSESIARGELRPLRNPNQEA